MTKLSLAYWQTPERREGRATKAFRFLWSVLCWIVAFSAVFVAMAIFRR